MIRALNLAMLALTVTICFGLYRVTHAAQERAQDLKSIEGAIAQEARSIDVLKAEWTHLAQPAKVQAMATRYLGLQPMKATQIAYLNDIPMRPKEASLSDLEAIPFTADGEHIPIYDETAPTPMAKPASVR
jgi:hypothetical protein